MKKNLFLIIIVIIIVISAIYLRINEFVNSNRVQINENKTQGQEMLGSDRDDHGCIGSAGYTWCEAKNKCLRIWEEECSSLVVLDEDIEEGSNQKINNTVEEESELEKKDKLDEKSPVEVVVSYPLPGDTITSPLEVRGRALGNWFFEAVLSLKLQSKSGEEIVSHYGEALEDWMSEDFVSFAGVLEFDTLESSGYLIVENANPSGLKEYSRQIIIPIKFK